MSKITCGIEKLKIYEIVDYDKNVTGYEYPTKREVVEKINEIIDRLDKIAECEGRR